MSRMTNPVHSNHGKIAYALSCHLSRLELFEGEEKSTPPPPISTIKSGHLYIISVRLSIGHMIA